MRRHQGIGDHCDPGSDSGQHGQRADRLSATARWSLLDDEGGGDPADQGFEPDGDQAQKGERGERRCEGAREVRHREAGHPDRDQPSPAEAIGKRRER